MMKKLVSVILTLAMALTFVLPAVAEDTVKVGVIGPMTRRYLRHGGR